MLLYLIMAHVSVQSRKGRDLMHLFQGVCLTSTHTYTCRLTCERLPCLLFKEGFEETEWSDRLQL